MDGILGLAAALNAVGGYLAIVAVFGGLVYVVSRISPEEIVTRRSDDWVGDGNTRPSWRVLSVGDHGGSWGLFRWACWWRVQRVSKRWRADQAVAETKVGIEQSAIDWDAMKAQAKR